MSENLVVRAGDAFLKSLNGCVSLPDEKTVIIEACILRRQFDTAIRAVIAAIREPTELMGWAGLHTGHIPDAAPAGACREIWQAMIGAALAEETK